VVAGGIPCERKREPALQVPVAPRQPSSLAGAGPFPVSEASTELSVLSRDGDKQCRRDEHEEDAKRAGERVVQSPEVGKSCYREVDPQHTDDPYAGPRVLGQRQRHGDQHEDSEGYEGGGGVRDELTRPQKPEHQERHDSEYAPTRCAPERRTTFGGFSTSRCGHGHTLSGETRGLSNATVQVDRRPAVGSYLRCCGHGLPSRAGEEGTQDDQELPDDRRAMSVAELGALTIVDALGFGPCSATT